MILGKWGAFNNQSDVWSRLYNIEKLNACILMRNNLIAMMEQMRGKRTKVERRFSLKTAKKMFHIEFLGKKTFMECILRAFLVCFETDVHRKLWKPPDLLIKYLKAKWNDHLLRVKVIRHIKVFRRRAYCKYNCTSILKNVLAKWFKIIWAMIKAESQ